VFRIWVGRKELVSEGKASEILESGDANITLIALHLSQIIIGHEQFRLGSYADNQYCKVAEAINEWE